MFKGHCFPKSIILPAEYLKLIKYLLTLFLYHSFHHL